MNEVILIAASGTLWLACAVWVATDARRRGAGTVFWALVTLAGGPPALAAQPLGLAAPIIRGSRGVSLL